MPPHQQLHSTVLQESAFHAGHEQQQQQQQWYGFPSMPAELRPSQAPALTSAAALPCCCCALWWPGSPVQPMPLPQTAAAQSGRSLAPYHHLQAG